MYLSCHMLLHPSLAITRMVCFVCFLLLTSTSDLSVLLQSLPVILVHYFCFILNFLGSFSRAQANESFAQFSRPCALDPSPFQSSMMRRALVTSGPSTDRFKGLSQMFKTLSINRQHHLFGHRVWFFFYVTKYLYVGVGVCVFAFQQTMIRLNKSVPIARHLGVQTRAHRILSRSWVRYCNAAPLCLSFSFSLGLVSLLSLLGFVRLCFFLAVLCCVSAIPVCFKPSKCSHNKIHCNVNTYLCYFCPVYC